MDIALEDFTVFVKMVSIAYSIGFDVRARKRDIHPNVPILPTAILAITLSHLNIGCPLEYSICEYFSDAEQIEVVAAR